MSDNNNGDRVDIKYWHHNTFIYLLFGCTVTSFVDIQGTNMNFLPRSLVNKVSFLLLYFLLTLAFLSLIRLINTHSEREKLFPHSFPYFLPHLKKLFFHIQFFLIAFNHHQFLCMKFYSLFSFDSIKSRRFKGIFSLLNTRDYTGIEWHENIHQRQTLLCCVDEIS